MGHNTTIFIGGPSFGLSGLGGFGFGGSSSGGISPFSLGGSLFNNGSGGIPGLDGTMFKLGFDALRGDLGSVIRDISDLGLLLSNAAGNQNCCGSQPLPTNFGGSPFSPTNGAGQPSESESGCQCGQSEEGGQSEEDRINDLLRQLLQAFGPLLQALSSLLGLVQDSLGNNNSINSSLNQNRFGGLLV